MKIVKAELQDGLHSEFKVWAYQQGVTMSQALVGLIETGLASSRYKDHAKAVSEPKKARVVRDAPMSKGIGAYELAKEHREQTTLKEDHGWCKGCGTTL